MKRIVALTICAFLLLSSACAEVIQIDTSTATIEELKVARDLIESRIIELKASQFQPESDENSVILTGNGTTILDGFTISAPISKLIAKCEKDTKITLYTNERTITLGEYGESQSSYTYLFKEPITFTQIMIETTGEWQFSFSPMMSSNSLEAFGTGSYITDSFTLTPPKIASITMSCNSYCYASVYLMKIGEDDIWQETCIPWGTQIHGTQQFDVIIKPDERIDEYFWKISCSPLVSWSITEK